MSGCPAPLVGKLGYAEDLRPEPRAHRVKKIRQRGVCRTLTRRAPRRARNSQSVKIVARGGGELSVRDSHRDIAYTTSHLINTDTSLMGP